MCGSIGIQKWNIYPTATGDQAIYIPDLGAWNSTIRTPLKVTFCFMIAPYILLNCCRQKEATWRDDWSPIRLRYHWATLPHMLRAQAGKSNPDRKNLINQTRSRPEPHAYILSSKFDERVLFHSIQSLDNNNSGCILKAENEENNSFPFHQPAQREIAPYSRQLLR